MLQPVAQVVRRHLLAAVGDGFQRPVDAVVAVADEPGLPIVGLDLRHEVVGRLLGEPEAPELLPLRVVAVGLEQGRRLADHAAVDTDLKRSELEPLGAVVGRQPGFPDLPGGALEVPTRTVHRIGAHDHAQARRRLAVQPLQRRRVPAVADGGLERRGDAVAIQLLGHPLKTVHHLVHVPLGQDRHDEHGAGVVPHGTQGMVLVVPFHGAARRVGRIVLDPHAPQTRSVEGPTHGLAVGDGHRVVGRHRIKVEAVRVAPVGEARRLEAPAPDPLAGLDLRDALLDGRDDVRDGRTGGVGAVHPVALLTVGHVDVVVDEPGSHRAPVEIHHLRLPADGLLDVGPAAYAQYVPAADRQRLGHLVAAIDGYDRTADKSDVGGGSRCRHARICHETPPWKRVRGPMPKPESTITAPWWMRKLAAEGPILPNPSFPRKRESRRDGAGYHARSAPPNPRIPAFAGMT